MPLTKDDFTDIFHAHTEVAEINGERRIVLPDDKFEAVTNMLLKRLLDHFKNSINFS